MKTSDEGLALIEHFEGYSRKAYRCPAGVWTIGYGHTNGVHEGDICTEAEAIEYLRQDVEAAERAANELVHSPLRQNQFNALVSFIFNVGAGNFAASSLLRIINTDAEDFTNIRSRFMMWVYAGGRKQLGLVRRRKAESDMYCERH